MYQPTCNFLYYPTLLPPKIKTTPRQKLNIMSLAYYVRHGLADGVSREGKEGGHCCVV